jgi:hypothetical protein
MNFCIMTSVSKSRHYKQRSLKHRETVVVKNSLEYHILIQYANVIGEYPQVSKHNRAHKEL